MKLEFAKCGESFAAEFDLTQDGSSVVIDGLNAKTVEYLLAYGFNQSLQDSIAGRAKKVAEEEKDKTAEEIESAVNADLIGALGKRLDAILAGTIGMKVGTPKSKLSHFDRVAMAMLKDYAKLKGKKLPKEKEKLDDLFGRYVEANRKAIEERVAAEKAQNEEIELDF